MDNDQIQQTNLVSDDAAAAMNDTAVPEIIQPEPGVTPVANVDPVPAPGSQPPVDPPAVDQPPAIDPVPAPEPPIIEPETEAAPVAEPTQDANGLDDIKKSALDELQPLIKHVEQSPEERFETVMMMIRSKDDPSLVSEAYEAAKGIENEKIRANALLNIVSEIEYLKSKSSN